MKGTSTSKKNLCPICGNHHGCKIQENKWVLCLRGSSQQDEPPGYRFIKPLRDGMGGLFGIDDSERADGTWQERIDRINQRRQRDRVTTARLLGVEERDRQYRAIVSQLGLSPQHTQLLLHRCLTLSDITQPGFRSWQPGSRVQGATSRLPGVDSRGERLVGGKGIFLPAYDPAGRITGAQIKTDNGRPGKYIWLSSYDSDKRPDGSGPQLPNGELPLFVWRHPDQAQVSLVILCEGALKSAISALLLWRSGLRDIAVIGTAASGFFGSDTLKDYLKQLAPQRVALAPDAGAVNNKSNIPAANHQTIKRCKAWGYPVEVLWWGQTHKTKHPDIDELLVAGRWSEVQALAPNEFFYLHPVVTREKLENHTPQRAGRWQSDFPISHPLPVTRFRPVIEYQAGERRQRWIELVKSGVRIIQDSSGLGLGKTYDAGLIMPSDFEAAQLIYVTNDPQNVTTETLKNCPVMRGRDGGRIWIDGPNGTKQLRRVRDGQTPDIPSNCERHGLASVLSERNVPATGAHICPGCPHLKSCRDGTGFYTYLFDRINTVSEPRYISHIDSLDPRTFAGYSKSGRHTPQTVLILDEASQQKLFKSFTAKPSDIDRTLTDLKALHPTHAALLEPVIGAIYSKLLSGKLPQYGLEHGEVLALLPELPKLTDEDIERVSEQGLEFLAPESLLAKYGFAPGTKMRDLPSDIRRLVRQDLQELTDQAAQIVALRWLPDFWKAVHGQGRLRLTAAGLEIMIKDKHRLGVLNHATVRAVILLDATEQSEHFEQWLGQPVTHARQAMPQHGALLEFVQVTGLGLNGFRRGQGQQRLSRELIEAIKALQSIPNDCSVITAQEFAHPGEGYYFRDSRASNAYLDKSALILDGAPFPNFGAIVDEFALITGRHPSRGTALRTYPINATNVSAGGPWWVQTLLESDDEELAAFYRHRVLAEIEQAAGRLRSNRRPGEKLTVYFLSDYPLELPVKVVDVSELLPQSKLTGITIEKIETASAKLSRKGKPVTHEAIAQVLGVHRPRVTEFLNNYSESVTTASHTAHTPAPATESEMYHTVHFEDLKAHKPYTERDTGWFDIVQNGLNIYSNLYNVKPHANPDLEPVSEVEPEKSDFGLAETSVVDCGKYSESVTTADHAPPPQTAPTPASATEAKLRIDSEPEEVQQAYWGLKTIWSADGLLRMLNQYGREICTRAAKYQSPGVKKDLKTWQAILKREGRL